jgi:hypothetical protein
MISVRSYNFYRQMRGKKNRQKPCKKIIRSEGGEMSTVRRTVKSRMGEPSAERDGSQSVGW